MGVIGNGTNRAIDVTMVSSNLISFDFFIGC